MPHKRLCWLFWVVLAPYISKAQTPIFRIHKPEEWGQMKMQAMFQDHSGWFWFGAEDGVFRYDGLAYDYFALPDSLINQGGVRCITERNANIWVGFNSGLIALVQYSGYRPASAGTSTDVLQFRQGMLSIWEPEEGTPQSPISDMIAAPSGIFWIATYGEGLYADTGRRIYQFNTADDGLSGDEIYDMIGDNDGNMWLATDAGISVCNISPDGQKTIWKIGLNDGLSDEIVTKLDKDRSGNIWIGTHDGGICKYDFQKKQIIKPFSNWDFGAVKGIAVYDPYEVWISAGAGNLYRGDLKTGLVFPVNAVFPVKQFRIRQLLHDREGQLWFLSQQGNIVSANMSLLQLETPFKSVQAVCSDRSEQIWAGTQEGLFMYQQGTWHPVHQGKTNVISLVETATGTIWAGTFGEGVFVFSRDGKLLNRLTVDSGLPNGSILSMATVTGKVWLTTLGGIVTADEQTGAITSFEKISGNAAAAKYYVYKVFADSRGRTWFCTDGYGLCLWQNQQFKSFTTAGGVTLKTIYSITEDREGRIWFSGDHTGLISFDGANFRRFTTENHLHSIQINSLSMTGGGQLVVGYNDGVDIITPATNHISFVSESAGAALTETNLNASSTDQSGHVWLGTAKGITRVSGFAQSFARDPATLIKSVANQSQVIDFHNDISFPYHQNNLTFEYAGNWQTNPNAVYFRYKLEGFDPEWKISRDRLSTYPNLPPGKYHFRVQSSEHGRFEDTIEASYTFTIRRPFWAEWWFILGAIAAVLMVARAYVKNRERRLQKEQEIKNEKIAAQLEAIKNQINPHFLFNSFNTLITIIEENPEIAVDYVQHLSDFYRSIMVYRERDFIPLKEEKEIAGNFGFLLKKRFEDALQIDIQINGNTGLIMPLTLQMLIENAVKHNVVSKKLPLKIEIFIESDTWLVVKNTRNLKIKPEVGTHFGLQSLIHRYEVLTHKKVIILQENGYFIVKVPLIYTDK
jgi:ligand-binding sensor domain-containing protein